ncbi:PH domain-containing protein [Longirhabdus pacifica]|uniref:PH domain-containing protein n=1 Tax=Longirhabdus pacifica TaxID=2305227 RepID=UPI0010088C0E|nr:PH domain-containing protein [Longirhabdus pacifica]
MEQQQPMKKIDKKSVRKAALTASWFSFFITMIVCAALLVVSIRFDWPLWIFYMVTIASVLGFTFEIFIYTPQHYRNWRYGIFEDRMELVSGVFLRKVTTIPIHRIQHVDQKQGPISRRFGLTTITVATAAGSHEIPDLEEETAKELLEEIITIARLTNEDI